VDQLAKEAAVNKDDRLSDSGYTSLTHVKVSVRRSCLRDWTKYIMEMHRKKRMGKFYILEGLQNNHSKTNVCGIKSIETRLWIL
jgi:hypothetical protein